MNTIERIFDGYAWLWLNAREPLIGLFLIALAALIGAAYFSSPAALAVGLLVLLLSLLLAWFHGEPFDAP